MPMTTATAAPPPLLDRILDVEPGRAASAVVNVPSTLLVLDTHFPRFPVLPGVLLLERMAATAELALPPSPGGWTLCGVSTARFRRYVRPGDSVRLDAELVSHDSDSGDATFRARAEADGVLVASAGSLRLRQRSTTHGGGVR